MKDFFLKDYKNNRSEKGITDTANTNIVLNPYYKGKRGNEKVQDGFSEYSSEHLMKKGEIYPGQIYTFVYNAKNP